MNDAIKPIGPPGPQVALLNSPAPAQKDGQPAKVSDNDSGFSAFGKDGFTFLDFIDVINPLQHIPLISTLYRNVTGDSIDPGSQIVGSTLFGGPIGAAVSIVNVAVDQNTGMDIGEHAVALFSEERPQDVGLRLAETNPLENFEIMSGLPLDRGYGAPTGAETALLNAERVEAFAETDPMITGAEIELLKAERMDGQALPESSITGAEMELLKAESRMAAKEAGIETEAAGAEIAFLKAEAEANQIPPVQTPWSHVPSMHEAPASLRADEETLSRYGGSQLLTDIEVLNWAQNEAGRASRKRNAFSLTALSAYSAGKPKPPAPPGATAALGGWFSQANYSAYQQGAKLAAAKTPALDVSK